MRKILIFATLFFYSLGSSWAKENKTENAQEQEHEHEHEKGEEKAHKDEEGENHSDHDDHKEEKGEAHAGHDDHGGQEEEEEGSSVAGPEKGIIEKGENGFKLAPEAKATFKLQIEPLKSGTLEITKKSLVEIKNGKFIYRVRDGWIRRIEVKVIKKQKPYYLVEVSQYKPGDEYVTEGIGFVRMSEILTEEGASHGHSH